MDHRHLQNRFIEKYNGLKLELCLDVYVTLYILDSPIYATVKKDWRW